MSTKVQSLSESPAVAPATSLSNEEILRYSRHLIMPEVGMEGQLKLKNAHRLDQIKDARDARGSLIAKDLDLQRMVRENVAQVREILLQRQRLLGTDDTDTLLSQYNLATVLKHENRYPEAEKLIRETLKTQTRVLDPNDPDTFASSSFLADVLFKEQKPQEAEVFARSAFNDQLRTLGPLHHDTIETLGMLGTELVKSGRYEDARRLYLDAINKVSIDKSEAQSGDVFWLWYNLACLAARAHKAPATARR